MSAAVDKHLHVLSRNRGELSGAVQPLTAEDVEDKLNGTGYRDEPALWDVVTGKLGRGYVVVDDGWVAVTRCGGISQAECAELLVRVAVAGDLRAAKQAGAL